MTVIALTVYGDPKGKGRPRFDPRTRRVYSDGATVSAETAIKDAWVTVGKPRLPDVPLAISVGLYIARPKSHFRRDGQLSTAGLREPLPARKPDVDNAIKLVMDSLNGLAYRDDVQITDAHVVRHWSVEPRTEVRVSVLEAPLLAAVAA